LRLAQFTAPRRREQFVLGRWLARRALCEHFGGDIVDWDLTAAAGRPPTAAGRPDIHLSLSHSGEWLACAVAAEPVGVDVEVIKASRDVDALAEIVCGDDERRRLAGLYADAAQHLFHCFWTLKEAWLKQRHVALDFQLMRRVQPQAADGGDADARTWLLPEHALVVALVSGAVAGSRFNLPHPLAARASLDWRLTLLEASPSPTLPREHSSRLPAG